MIFAAADVYWCNAASVRHLLVVDDDDGEQQQEPQRHVDVQSQHTEMHDDAAYTTVTG